MSARSASPARDWFGQPRGLAVLVLTQMWEAFSFYGMRALLVLYLTRGLDMPVAKASLIYGGYTGCAYLTTIVGGVLADRWLGRHHAVILGAAIMAAGHFALAFPDLLFPALATIAIGNGLFLPSLPSQIGGLFQPDDPRRDPAYTLYYAGLNLGAVLAPLVCGLLGETLGWHWGFGAAGVGMLLGLTIYVAGSRYLAPVSARAGAATVPPGVQARRRPPWVLLGVLAAVVVFRGAYEQAGNAIALWTAADVDRHVAGGLEIPMTWFQSLNPLFVFALVPLVLILRRRGGRAPDAGASMMWGALATVAAFAGLAVVAAVTGRAGGQAHWLWLVGFFALYTWGELLILPMGLALFGRLAPASYAATGIAVWYAASFAGNLFAGALGTLWSRLAPGPFFALMAVVAASSALGLALLAGPLRRLAART